MSNRESSNTADSRDERADPSDGNDEGQALQINENTIEDPDPRSADDYRDTGLHGRRDVPTREQGLQINENTIDDPEPPSESGDHRS